MYGCGYSGHSIEGEMYGYRWFAFLPFFVTALAADASANESWMRKRVHEFLSHQVELYKDLHQMPEPSGDEINTARVLGNELGPLGFQVTSGIGGFGVVGLLRNGQGPTVLIRTDMDALPVTEKTGLPYESGRFGYMHACGHDVHMATWVGTARLLAAERHRWKGTLVMVAQPAEELGTGANRMLTDGLYGRFPMPNFALAIHDTERLPAGKVELIPGYAGASVDTVEIKVLGKGGHGARPHLTVDPIVLGSMIVVRLQTIVAREVNPVEPAVVSVGFFHAGTKDNIIPDEAVLKLTVRSRSPEVRDQLLSAIQRIARAEAEASQAPEPVITVTRGPLAPYNDPELVDRLIGPLQSALGAGNAALATSKSMGGEDFGEFLVDGVRGAMIYVGAINPKLYEQWQTGAAEPYGIHSPFFAPDPEPTIETATIALSTAALELFRSR